MDYAMLTTCGQYFMQNWPTWISATLCGNADNMETIRQGTNHKKAKQTNATLKGLHPVVLCIVDS